jgi:catechol 2,3-dioxygenase-like lactoylglutathione lyase family enzyme
MRKQSPFLNVVVRKFTGAARRRNPRPSESLLSPSIRGNAVAAPPAFSKVGRTEDSPPCLAWPQEDCANEPSPLHCFSEQRTLWALAAKVSIALLLFVALSAQAAVREVGAIGLTVGDLDRVLPFYTNTLPFELKGITTAGGEKQDALLGLSKTKTRSAELLLGHERITLTEHLTNKGCPIPPDSRSFDHWFQHIAIVVSDMDKAYEQLRRAQVKHVSTAPQTLPAWNKDAGGIKAFYFRDPEGHVLEIICFPPGKGDPKWQQPTTNLFLGIDHTAIVVSDTERSLMFYTNTLGLRVAGGAENYGTEQEHLNQVFGARLRITALRAERGPGIEFLEYITPPGGRPLPDDATASDLVFWHTQLVADDVPGLSARLRATGARFVSRPGMSASQIVRDPDGHALQLSEAGRGRDGEALTSQSKGSSGTPSAANR